MKIAFFDTHHFEQEFFNKANLNYQFDIHFIETRLSEQTVALAHGHDAVCAFVNDRITEKVCQQLKQIGIKLIALRCAGFNNVDMKAATANNIKVVRVPEYSPYAVAEHAASLLMALNRKLHKAYHRVRDANFSLDGLVGFDLHNKTVGIIGTGKIGKVFSKIMAGYGCKILLYDVQPDQQFAAAVGGEYVSLDQLLKQSHVISLHCPLNNSTQHLIDETRINSMKKGVVIINTGRGALIDTKALVSGLISGQVGAAGLDVYEEEDGIFFRDLSDVVLKDDVLARLLTFPNVLITSHQAFLTQEALQNISETTLQNISQFQSGQPLANEVRISL